MVDRGQAPPDWLASFKKAHSVEKTAQNYKMGGLSPHQKSIPSKLIWIEYREKALRRLGHCIHFPSPPTSTQAFMYSTFPSSLFPFVSH